MRKSRWRPIPGTTEHDSFAAYRDAGINRVSRLGFRVLMISMLQAIGRIHGRSEVDRALDSIGRSGIQNFNLDLMFALAGASLDAAIADMRLAHRRRTVPYFPLPAHS